MRTERCEIWNLRTAPLAEPRRVLIAHADSSVGDYFALLLAMRGFEAVQIGEARSALRLLRQWRPQVLFVDTLVGDAHDHALVRQLRATVAGDGEEIDVPLTIALAADRTRDPADALHEAGYDGFCRKPCPVWWLYDVLKCFYAR
ncbi:unnamed protein product [Candidatus Paraburkholderia kirkii UZHbot1]|uniref:WGS project CAFE00000000 data, contig bkir_c89 n=1 Tax=Candidatus Paraburkholderia kirkii UZHbot1 TaxID=1055526 RepID=U3UB50_9BURK|nr:unnamed protein product [Candidatus Paraburkholderia kirkii UZHbot1]